jgi:adenylate cyclase
VRLTLRITITLSITLITVATALALLTLDYHGARRSLTSFAGTLLDPLADLVGEKTRGFLQPVERAAALSAELVESAGADPSRFDAIEERWYSILQTEPDLFYIQYGDADGNFQLLTRRPDGSLATQRILRHGGASQVTWRDRAPGQREVRATRTVSDSYDPRGRPWYQGAIEHDGIFWTDVYIHAAERRPVVTAARRVRAGGRVVGVTSVTIALDRLSTFLGGSHIARRGRAVIADHDGHIVASSEGALLRMDGDTVRLRSLADAGSPALVALAATPAWQQALAGSPGDATFQAGQRGYLAVVQPLRLHPRDDWVVAAVVPDEDYLAGIRRDLTRDILVSALITVVFVGLGLLLGRAVGAALTRVVVETREVQRLNFDGTLPGSRFLEIEHIFRTYDRLKVGLRAFEKYVPMRLVRMLLQDQTDPQLGGRLETLTIFFSDIRGFTSLSERMTPGAVAELLGEYFQCLSDVISAHAGTVDKYIGDGIMAFWNAPRADADHALHAVQAALRCRAAVDGLPQPHRFFTRFGLHTGEVMVGNFGARDRFSYTILGDAVNLASRLEGANNEYRTQLLLSEATAALVRGPILCRPIDRVAVKGRALPTLIFEALCLREEATAAQEALVREYEEALLVYFHGDFAGAAARFQQLGARFPDDGPSQVMLRRCHQLAALPSPPRWTGIHELTSK